MHAHLLLVLKFAIGIIAIILQVALGVGLLVLFVCWEDIFPPFRKKVWSKVTGDTADAEPYPD